MLVALGLGATLLSGCATAHFDVACPSLVEYSREDQVRAADELDSLPADSALGRFMADYGRLRQQVRACRKASG